MRPVVSAARLEAGLRRLVPLAALGIAFLWAPLVASPSHSWDDADPEVLNNAYRLARGEPLYHGIDAPPWVVNPYTPLYHVLVAAGLRVTGLSYTPARLVSLLSSLSLAAALAVLARRRGGRAREGLWAAGLLVLVPAVLYNAARPHPQMLAVALSVWSFVLFESRSALLADLLSPLLAVLAVYTKQTQIALPLALTAWLAWRERKRLLRWVTAVLLLGLAPVPWLQVVTHGAFLDCVVGLNLLPYDAKQALPILVHHAGILFLLLGLALVRFGERLRAGAGEPVDFYFAVVLVLTLVSLGRAGAHGQYVVELLVVTVLLLLGTGGLLFPPGREALGAAQLALVLVYAPLFVLLEEGPFARASLRAAGPVRALLRTDPGPVLSQQGSFALFTRGEIRVQLFHFAALARQGRWDASPLLREVERQCFAWVVTESALEGPLEGDDDLERFTPELRGALARNYVRKARIEPYYVYQPRAPTPGACNNDSGPQGERIPLKPQTLRPEPAAPRRVRLPLVARS